ncbi:MAG TPA: OadG family transporter subunit [Dehalococcoidia bacterium]|nr:OadG family transporter subunit [Dehalococcoidia bacterium]
MVDWMEALKVGGIGFATVMVVLVLLSLVLWLVSLILYKTISKRKKDTIPEGK